MLDRPHLDYVDVLLDYVDVLYDQTFNNFFQAKMESIQYNACLTITRVIRGQWTKGQNLPRNRPRVPSTSSLVEKTLSLL